MSEKQLFENVSDYIENDDIKTFLLECIKNIPKYWYHVSASSSAKYHPLYALGDGGLLKHSVAVVKLINHMFHIEYIKNQFTSRERDLLLVAALMHDSMKSGTQEEYEGNKQTKFNHPLLAAELVRSIDGLNKEEKELIAHVIESHMGSWNTDKRYPNLKLPTPQDKYQIIVHLADYLASRKDIEIKFDNMEVVLPTIDSYRFDFGKHKGKTIPEIAAVDPGYIKWAKENIEKEPFRTLIKDFEIH